jgi:hypothetical protein
MTGLGEHSLRILESTGSSFVVGASTALLSSAVRNRRPCFAVEYPARSGGDSATYTLLYSLLYYGLERLGLVSCAKTLGSSFLASFIVGCRNGVPYAVKSGISGAVTAVLASARWMQ